MGKLTWHISIHFSNFRNHKTQTTIPVAGTRGMHSHRRGLQVSSGVTKVHSTLQCSSVSTSEVNSGGRSVECTKSPRTDVQARCVTRQAAFVGFRRHCVLSVSVQFNARAGSSHGSAMCDSPIYMSRTDVRRRVVRRKDIPGTRRCLCVSSARLLNSKVAH